MDSWNVFILLLVITQSVLCKDVCPFIPPFGGELNCSDIKSGKETIRDILLNIEKFFPPPPLPPDELLRRNIRKHSEASLANSVTEGPSVTPTMAGTPAIPYTHVTPTGSTTTTATTTAATKSENIYSFTRGFSDVAAPSPLPWFTWRFSAQFHAIAPRTESSLKDEKSPHTNNNNQPPNGGPFSVVDTKSNWQHTDSDQQSKIKENPTKTTLPVSEEPSIIQNSLMSNQQFPENMYLKWHYTTLSPSISDQIFINQPPISKPQPWALQYTTTNPEITFGLPANAEIPSGLPANPEIPSGLQRNYEILSWLPTDPEIPSGLPTNRKGPLSSDHPFIQPTVSWLYETRQPPSHITTFPWLDFHNNRSYTQGSSPAITPPTTPSEILVANDRTSTLAANALTAFEQFCRQRFAKIPDVHMCIFSLISCSTGTWCGDPADQTSGVTSSPLAFNPRYLSEEFLQQQQLHQLLQMNLLENNN